MSEKSRWGAWGAVIAALTLASGLVLALGVTPPGARLDRAEKRLDDHEARINKVEQGESDMRQDVGDIKSDVKEILRRLPK